MRQPLLRSWRWGSPFHVRLALEYLTAILKSMAISETWNQKLGPKLNSSGSLQMGTGKEIQCIKQGKVMQAMENQKRILEQYPRNIKR